MNSKGFTLKDLLFVMLIVCLTAFVISETRLANVNPKCRANLRQIGLGLQTYSNDYANGIMCHFPDANGAYFLGRLYKVGILTDSNTYLCPGTLDNNRGHNLGVESGIQPYWISYAGRKNKKQNTYPGICRCVWRYCHCLTTVASDDWEVEPNHQNGQLINFLYLDGHVDWCRDTTLSKDNYEAFVTTDYKWADPLTN